MGTYIQREIYYTEDGRLMEKDTGYAIMMDWEKPLMDFQAKQICQNGGDIINIGYGMGFADNEIEKHNPKTHSIIEIHPTVQNRILSLGWHKKSHMRLYFGDWRSFKGRLPKFDGIYFDTWDEEMEEYIDMLPSIMKPTSIATFFNNPKDDKDGDNLPDKIRDQLNRYFDIEMTTMQIPFIDTNERQTGKEDWYYWNQEWTTYYSPLLRLKK